MLFHLILPFTLKTRKPASSLSKLSRLPPPSSSPLFQNLPPKISGSQVIFREESSCNIRFINRCLKICLENLGLLLSTTMASSSQNKGKSIKTYARKKAAPAPEIEEGLPLSSHVSQFLTTSQYNKFLQCCASREVVVERLFDKNFLIEIEFPWISRLDDWGWWSFIACKREVYPDIVRMFYFCGDNQKKDDEGNPRPGEEYDDYFRTVVLGKEIHVHADSIRKFVCRQLKRGGERFVPSNYPVTEFCKTVFQDPTIDYFEDKTAKMDLHTRILHLIVCQALHPRKGNYALATRRDIYVMAKIMMNEPPDLACLIVEHMIEAVKFSKSRQSPNGLPYGKLVSKICSSQNPIPANEPVMEKGGLSIFTKKSVKLMGWVYDKDTKSWSKRGKRREAEEEENEDENEDEGETGQATLQAILNEVRGVSSRMDRIEARQASLESQILYVHNTFLASQQNTPLTEPFPFFQPPPN